MMWINFEGLWFYFFGIGFAGVGHGWDSLSASGGWRVGNSDETMRIKGRGNRGGHIELESWWKLVKLDRNLYTCAFGMLCCCALESGNTLLLAKIRPTAMFMMQLDNTWYAKCIRHGPVQIIYNIIKYLRINFPTFFPTAPRLFFLRSFTSHVWNQAASEPLLSLWMINI
jgi:hypothetical protein